MIIGVTVIVEDTIIVEETIIRTIEEAIAIKVMKVTATKAIEDAMIKNKVIRAVVDKGASIAADAISDAECFEFIYKFFIEITILYVLIML